MKCRHTIQTERLVLREIELKDAEQITAWRSDPEIYCYFKNPHALTIGEHLEWYQNIYLKSDGVISWIAIEKNGWSAAGIYGAYSFDRTDDRYANEKVIFLGYYCTHWGHFLLDCVSRFWILGKEEYKDYRVVYLPREGHSIGRNYLRFLELSGIAEGRQICVDRPFRFAEIVIPSLANDSKNRSHAKVFGNIFKNVADRAEYDKSKVPEKVYFSRRGLFSHTEYGEREIEENFAKNGFQICYPEKMTLDDQISIYKHASVIACQNSSLPLNLVFSKPKVKWIVINKSSGVHEALIEFQHIVPVEMIYIDGYSKRYVSTIGKGGMFYLYLNKYMKRFFIDEGMQYQSLGCVYALSNIIGSALRAPYHLVGLSRLHAVVLLSMRRFLIRRNPEVFKKLKRIRDTVKMRGRKMMY